MGRNPIHVDPSVINRYTAQLLPEHKGTRGCRQPSQDKHQADAEKDNQADRFPQQAPHRSKPGSLLADVWRHAAFIAQDGLAWQPAGRHGASSMVWPVES
jgi:hypothetical protein